MQKWIKSFIYYQNVGIILKRTLLLIKKSFFESIWIMPYFTSVNANAQVNHLKRILNVFKNLARNWTTFMCRKRSTAEVKILSHDKGYIDKNSVKNCRSIIDKEGLSSITTIWTCGIFYHKQNWKKLLYI